MQHATFPGAMRRLINELTKLPSIGEKTAIRLAYHLLVREGDDALKLALALQEAQKKIRLCESCFALAEGPQCEICSDENRLPTTICVVEKPADVIAIERSGGYKGRYHVLHGVWSPLRGVSPEKIKLAPLFQRLESSNPPVEELMLATSTTVEGDATALYIASRVEHLPLRVTRIAQGIPKGGELEYADEVTLSHAIEGRRKL